MLSSRLNIESFMLLLFCLLFQANAVIGQSNPYQISTKILKNTTYTSFPIDGDAIRITKTPSNGNADEIVSGGELFLSYTPNLDYLGKDRVVFEIQDGYIIPFARIYYYELLVEVVESIVDVKTDHYSLQDFNSIDLNVMGNDNLSDGSAALSKILVVRGGTAQIDSNQINYIPDPNAKMGMLEYVVCDSFQNCAQASVQIQHPQSGNANISELITLDGRDQIQAFLPSSDFVLTANQARGIVQLDTSSSSFTYTPIVDSGMDTLVFSDGISDVQMTMDIIKLPTANSFVRDDYFTTTVEQEVSFDVLDNDVVRNFFIDGHSQPEHGQLSYVGNGVYNYTPDSTFSGYDEFEYEICFYTNCEKGKVTIKVSDRDPQTQLLYSLNTLYETQLVLDYAQARADCAFLLNTAPAHGQLQIVNGPDTLSMSCEPQMGANVFVYEPDTAFVGVDVFSLDFCDADLNCTTLQFEVEVQMSMSMDSCHCGMQCVWPGDVNNDGFVGKSDLLELASHIGTRGPARGVTATADWYAQMGAAWSGKYADVDGDGWVSYDDASAVINHLGKTNNIVETNVAQPKPYDVGVRWENDAIPEVGDTARMLVYCGTKQNPARLTDAFALSLYLAPETFDTSSIKVELIENNWINRESAALNLSYAKGSNLQLATARTDGRLRTGYGNVYAVDIVIEDILDGLRPEGGLIYAAVPIYGVAVQQNGGQIHIGQDLQVNLPIRVSPDKKIELEEKSSIFYPNPTEGELFLMDESTVIESIEVFDLQGRLIDRLSGLNTNGAVNLQHLKSGAYLLKVQTPSGMHTQKLIKL